MKSRQYLFSSFGTLSLDDNVEFGRIYLMESADFGELEWVQKVILERLRKNACHFSFLPKCGVSGWIVKLVLQTRSDYDQVN